MTTYIKIFAGLGNRLFQYSYGKHLLEQGYDVRFIVADDGNTDILNVMDMTGTENLFLTKQKLGFLKYNSIKFFAKYITHTYKIGFFQEVQFAKCTNFIFKNKNKYDDSELLQKIKSTPSVSIHIRGGDYLDPKKAQKFIGVCTRDYYINAIKKIMTKLSSPVFFIFTNDKSYAMQIVSQCKLGELGVQIFFARESQFTKDAPLFTDDGFHLYAMSQCKNNIIANSTFSWWGAYLNSNKQKIVITPAHWTNKDNSPLDNLILDEWEKI